MIEPVNPGTSVRLGRYEILQEIGRGAMGVVYLAHDPLIARRVALKVFRVGFSASDDELRNLYARFIREAQSAGILSHPNIVTVHDVAQAEGDSPAFIAMEFVEGRTLKQLLDAPESISPRRAIELVLQVTAALGYAHSMGVVHRDVKPGNILVTDDGHVKITDFGIALVNAANITNHGQLLGTPNYMAPEAIEEREVDQRADLFSLGVVLYELLTRHKPFAGENMTKVTHRIIYEPFTPPSEYVRGLSPALVNIITRTLEKDPGERYQTAAELGTELERAYADEPELADTAVVEISTRESSPADTQSVPVIAPPPEKQPPSGQRRGSVAAAFLAALKRPTPIGRLPVWLLVVGVIAGLALGYLATAPGDPPPEPAVVESLQLVSPLQPLEDRVAILEALAADRLRAGDLEGTRLALLEAARIRPESGRLRELARQAEERRAGELELWRAEVEEYLARSRRSLADGRILDAIGGAERALALDPMNLEAPDLVARSEAEGERIRARREAMESPVVVAPAPVEPAEPAPTPTVEAAKPEPAEPVATVGTLVIHIDAARSPGVLTIYKGENQLFSERFRFIPEAKKKGFLSQLKRQIAAKGGPGELTRELEWEPGTVDLRVYVSMKGSQTQVFPIRGHIAAGASGTLKVRIDKRGRASVVLE